MVGGCRPVAGNSPEFHMQPPGNGDMVIHFKFSFLQPSCQVVPTAAINNTVVVSYERGLTMLFIAHSY